MQTRTCEYCGEAYEPKQLGVQRFCSRTCSDSFFDAERRFSVHYIREHNIPVPVPATERVA
jgi:hypothetical protein